MNICILGSTGMLGSTVARYFVEHYGEDNVWLSYRDSNVAFGKNQFYFDALEWVYGESDQLRGFDYIINCIGVIKPFINKSKSDSIVINSLFPHILANWCKSNNMKMIGITTDCVFSGLKGNYIETDLHDCDDDYGKTKSLGETENCMMIRTSIIGEEIHKNASLVEWAKSQKGKKVNGFTNHIWNGITTKQFAKVCDQIIRNNLYQDGLFHVFSNKVNKYELLTLINESLKLDLDINPMEAAKAIDRSMSTVKDLCGKLTIPTLKEQIQDI